MDDEGKKMMEYLAILIADPIGCARVMVVLTVLAIVGVSLVGVVLRYAAWVLL